MHLISTGERPAKASWSPPSSSSLSILSLLCGASLAGRFRPASLFCVCSILCACAHVTLTLNDFSLCSISPPSHRPYLPFLCLFLSLWLSFSLALSLPFCVRHSRRPSGEFEKKKRKEWEERIKWNNSESRLSASTPAPVRLPRWRATDASLLHATDIRVHARRSFVLFKVATPQKRGATNLTGTVSGSTRFQHDRSGELSLFFPLLPLLQILTGMYVAFSMPFNNRGNFTLLFGWKFVKILRITV